MKLALFGGSFDPVHTEHVRLVKAAKDALGLDKIVVIPSFIAPHKAGGAVAGGEERLEMCRLAFRSLPFVEVSDCEIVAGGTSYSYLTCQNFAEQYPNAELFFLVGADMLENFFTWRKPEEIVRLARLVACGRGESVEQSLHARFLSRFGTDFIGLPFTGKEVSSTRIRTDLAFGKQAAIDDAVAAYIAERGLYAHPAIAPALALETEERREHSYRVACMACSRARSLGVSEEKARLAAALHDCGKSVPLSSPLLAGFAPPEGVPAPVLHQYTGAYLAERAFGISDAEILSAIRCHTSAKENMSPLDKLIYLADLLEEGRSYGGVEALRALFWEDIDACLTRSLKEQIEYLERAGKPVYPLTRRAYEWIKQKNRA